MGKKVVRAGLVFILARLFYSAKLRHLHSLHISRVEPPTVTAGCKSALGVMAPQTSHLAAGTATQPGSLKALPQSMHL